MTVLQPGTAKDAGISPERLERIRDMCAGWVADGSTPALIVIAARHGIIFLQGAWGQLGSEPDSAPVALDSTFGVASVSKVVTATAVLKLVETGRVGIHQPVQKYLPEFKGPDCEKIIVRHLLTHTSGLPYRSESSPLRAGQLGLEREPGSLVAYSNAGYDLLGILVENISGMSFSDYTRREIFEPLGMKDSTFIHGDTTHKRCIRRRPGTAFDWPEQMEGTTSASSTL
jgi:CubicO group peptidase (beta-lactamase class C family)